MREKLLFLVVGILGVGIFQSQAQAPQKPTPVAARWQIVVSRVTKRDVFLLDTATGVSYVECEDKDGTDSWCLMTRDIAINP